MQGFKNEIYTCQFAAIFTVLSIDYYDIKQGFSIRCTFAEIFSLHDVRGPLCVFNTGVVATFWS